jgi:molybdenum cofactor cytidylyltransferase
MRAERIGAIVMAAGAGRRMGYRPKCLLQHDGVPLIERTLRLLLESGVAPVVVLGHHAERIELVLQRLCDTLAAPERLQWVRNPEPDAGQGGSTRCGLAALPPDLDGVLIALADQPLLQAQDIRAILDAWAARAPGIELVLPMHQGQPGHPLVFGPAVRRAVAAGQGGAGVREWRRAHAAQVQALALDHARCTTDIDTEADVARLAAERGVLLSWAEWP